MSADLMTEIDTADNGGDITNLLVPGTGMFLPAHALLTDPARRAQFREDLRLLTQNLIDRHKNSAAASNRWMFWGRTARFNRFNAMQTDFGHNIKSYAMVHNANQLYPDRPWDALAADRAILLERAWDGLAARWNQDLRNFMPGNVDRRQRLVDARRGRPAAGRPRPRQRVRPRRPARPERAEVPRRVRRPRPGLPRPRDLAPGAPHRSAGAPTGNRKSFFGKNMLHNFEHALVLYLHGRRWKGSPPGCTTPCLRTRH